MGLPVISTDEGAIPEIIEGKRVGDLVDAKDFDALSKILEKYITFPAIIDEYSVNAYRHFHSKYTLAKFEGHLVTILDELTV